MPNKLTLEGILDKADKDFVEIIGLEKDPNGRENMYLIRDQDDVVEYGIDFDDERKFLRESLKESVTSLLQGLVEEIEKEYQDTRPVDVFTGEPVETYGYEETHNQALKKSIAIINAVLIDTK